MSLIITSDTHLTSVPRDEHRWQLFPWLRKQMNKHSADLAHLGDLTDQKDRHPSTLVNRLVEELGTLPNKVTLVRGNHDCIQEEVPFFRFLSKMDVRYINKPTEFAIEKNVNALFLPNTRNYQEDWKSLDHLGELVGGDVKQCDYIFCHQTFDGSLAENGTELRGIPPSFFAGFRGRVVSGDIHTPQNVNKQIMHVGSPYRVHFGDTFTPRVLLLQDGKFTDLHFHCVSREVITVRGPDALEEIEFEVGTQVKVRVRLKRSEYPEWATIRKQVQEMVAKKGWELCGLELVELLSRRPDREIELEESRSPEDVVREYGRDRKVAKDMIEAGLGFLKDAG